jgi:hypothetical protein
MKIKGCYYERAIQLLFFFWGIKRALNIIKIHFLDIAKFTAYHLAKHWLKR